MLTFAGKDAATAADNNELEEAKDELLVGPSENERHKQRRFIRNVKERDVTYVNCSDVFWRMGAGNGAAESDGRDDVRNGRHAATPPALRDVGDRVDDVAACHDGDSCQRGQPPAQAELTGQTRQ